MRLAALTLAVAAILACSQTGDDGGAGGTGGASTGQAGAGGGPGGQTGSGGDQSGRAGGGGRSGAGGVPACLPTAPARVCDPACPSGHYCWDFKDHDPYCGGKACTGACCSDADCVAYFAGHTNAANARCGSDHLCDPIAFGGSFFCAAP